MPILSRIVLPYAINDANLVKDYVKKGIKTRNKIGLKWSN